MADPMRQMPLEDRYEIHIAYSEEDGVFVASIPDLPFAGGHGDTQEEALAMAKAAIRAYLLTMRLIDEDLYAVYPRRYNPMARGKSMEEHYREIYREFVQVMRHLQARGYKRCRKKAYEVVAQRPDTPLSVRTVERAVHFVESVEGGPFAKEG